MVSVVYRGFFYSVRLLLSTCCPVFVLTCAIMPYHTGSNTFFIIIVFRHDWLIPLWILKTRCLKLIFKLKITTGSKK